MTRPAPHRVDRWRALAAFGLVGAASAAVDGGVFLLLLQVGVDPAPASAAGFLCAFVVNYRGNRDLVFRARDGSGGALARYTALVGVNLVLSTAGVGLLVHQGAPAWSAKLTTMVVVAVLNFVVMRHWVFRPDRNGGPRP